MLTCTYDLICAILSLEWRQRAVGLCETDAKSQISFSISFTENSKCIDKGLISLRPKSFSALRIISHTAVSTQVSKYTQPQMSVDDINTRAIYLTLSVSTFNLCLRCGMDQKNWPAICFGGHYR